MKTTRKRHYLVIFDFDHTLINDNTDQFIPPLLMGEAKYREQHDYHRHQLNTPWQAMMSALVAPYTRDQIRAVIVDEKNKVKEKFHPETVRMLRELGAHTARGVERQRRRNEQQAQQEQQDEEEEDFLVEMHVASDSNTLFIPSCLSTIKEDLEQGARHQEGEEGATSATALPPWPFASVHTNTYSFNDETMTSAIEFYEPNHGCERCAACKNMCKGKLVERLMHHHNDTSTNNTDNAISILDTTVIYVGDGSNDFCPILSSLRAKDFVFVRRGYALETRLAKHQGSGEEASSNSSAAALHHWLPSIEFWSDGSELRQLMHRHIPQLASPTTAKAESPSSSLLPPLYLFGREENSSENSKPFRTATLQQRMPALLERTLAAAPNVVSPATRDAVRSWFDDKIGLCYGDQRQPSSSSSSSSSSSFFSLPCWCAPHTPVAELPWFHGEALWNLCKVLTLSNLATSANSNAGTSAGGAVVVVGELDPRNVSPHVGKRRLLLDALKKKEDDKASLLPLLRELVGEDGWRCNDDYLLSSIPLPPLLTVGSAKMSKCVPWVGAPFKCSPHEKEASSSSLTISADLIATCTLRCFEQSLLARFASPVDGSSSNNVVKIPDIYAKEKHHSVCFFMRCHMVGMIHRFVDFCGLKVKKKKKKGSKEGDDADADDDDVVVEMRHLSPNEVREELHCLLRQSLWGNVIDLSMFSVEQNVAAHHRENARTTGVSCSSPSSSSSCASPSCPVEAARAEGALLREKDEKIAGSNLDAMVDYLCEQLHAPSPLSSSSSKSSSFDMHIVMDNVGVECLGDLLLACFLLVYSSNKQRSSSNKKKADPVVITLHVKALPYYVSDTMTKDILHLLDQIELNAELLLLSKEEEEEEEVHDKARACLAFVECTRHFLRRSPSSDAPHIVVNDKCYVWNYPLEVREYTHDIFVRQLALHRADLVIFKGDLNFRRLVGDRAWPRGTTFRQALRDFWPLEEKKHVRVAALRTCKSEVCVGVSNETMDRLDREDKELRQIKNSEGVGGWRVSGDFAVALFV